MKQSIYIETTIPSYLAARTSNNIIIAGKQATTHEFFETEAQKYDLFISDYVLDECEKGDPIVSKKRIDFVKGISLLEITPEIEPLADEYMRILSIPNKNRMDALHLAMCCVYGIDILLSWNCAHLGVESMTKVLKYNTPKGLHTPQMVTPDNLVTKYMEVDLDV